MVICTVHTDEMIIYYLTLMYNLIFSKKSFEYCMKVTLESRNAFQKGDFTSYMLIQNQTC